MGFPGWRFSTKWTVGYVVSGWSVLLAQAGEQLDQTGPGVARGIGLLMAIVAILVVILLGLGGGALVLMMGGRLKRRVQDGVPPAQSPPDPMWPLQVPPAAEENQEAGAPREDGSGPETL